MAGAPGNQWQDMSTAWNVVGEFVASVAVYGTGGWYADKWLGTGHFLFLGGLLFGLFLGVYILIKRGDQAADAAVARRRNRASS